MPKRLAPRIQELAMLKRVSPRKAIFRPRSEATRSPFGPAHRSAAVKASARIWQGCRKSVNPLITGTVAAAASRSTSPVVVGPHHEAVDKPGKDPGRVLDRLAPAQLDVIPIQEQGVASELMDPDLEGHPGPGARLGEEQGPGLSGQRRRSAPRVRVQIPPTRFRLNSRASLKTSTSSVEVRSLSLRKCFMAGNVNP